MIDFLKIDTNKLNTGQQLLQGEFKKRNWQVQTPYIGSPHCFIRRNDTDNELHIFSTTPPSTSYAAAHLANDKYATHQLLQSRGINQLQTMIATNSTDEATLKEFLNKVQIAVVKPLDGGHGKGITLNVQNMAEMGQAITYGLQFTNSSNKVVIQQQYGHKEIVDIRIACINYKYVAATLRTPAKVVGDGVHTALELIELENISDKRGEPYRAPLARINVEAAVTYLAHNSNHIVPKGEKFQVIGVANYGAGGEIIDATDDIPDRVKNEAISAAKAAELPVCGVDFMFSSVPTAHSTQQEINPIIVEINKCPSLAIHDLPTQGKPRKAVCTYVDYLATL